MTALQCDKIVFRVNVQQSLYPHPEQDASGWGFLLKIPEKQTGETTFAIHSEQCILFIDFSNKLQFSTFLRISGLVETLSVGSEEREGMFCTWGLVKHHEIFLLVELVEDLAADSDYSIPLVV